ncbi:AbiH family protein [Flavobacterium sp. C4GT6]|uniref:AbiH family protein n=1 Tax=Flavobacterium sp. C4GT6 TaxID=3103818 RepID=UPI002ED20158
MNRLVIIGNGFDLAHGLPTGYNHFINDYWINVFNNVNNKGISYDDDLFSLALTFKSQHSREVLEWFLGIKNYKEFKSFLIKCKMNKNSSFSLRVRFGNSFFQSINDHFSIKNWVDIENEYYRLLKGCLEEFDDVKVKKLNREFEQVKNLLEQYLNENINSRFDFKSPSENSNLLTELFDVQTRKTDLYLKEFSYRDQGEVKRNLSQSKLSYDNEKGEKCLFLNFNYTSTADNYCEAMNTFPHIYGGCRIIQIHGRLNDSENKINFGFGDEMDDDYKKIENKDDNEYLRNIKSFQYLQNSNYKDMLDFVESEIFQVYIMGHSCGLSDRILLNKIFEHHNCKSIKVFYYKNGDWDNYTEIIQNISRHFNKKEMMREKIVNKTLCQPLPQEIRFKEKNNDS